MSIPSVSAGAGFDQERRGGINFGLLQLGLGGGNAAAELRYHRLWLEYSRGMALTLNNLGGFGLTRAERDQNLHVRVRGR